MIVKMKFLSLLVLAAAVIFATGAVAQHKPADNVHETVDAPGLTCLTPEVEAPNATPARRISQRRTG